MLSRMAFSMTPWNGRAKNGILPSTTTSSSFTTMCAANFMPLKVQAYERFLLYLERVQLPQLVKRVYTPGMEKGTFHLQLLQNVREEFEHNLAQQLYVSNSTWNAVVNAKEELVNQINTTFDQLKDEEDVSILAQSLVALPNPMVEQAVAVLKHDFERLL